MLLEDGDFLPLVDHLWICEIVEWSPLCNERCSWNQQMVIEHLKLEFVLSKSLSLSVTRSSIVSGAAMLMIWREKKRFKRRSLWFNKSSPVQQINLDDSDISWYQAKEIYKKYLAEENAIVHFLVHVGTVERQGEFVIYILTNFHHNEENNAYFFI